MSLEDEYRKLIHEWHEETMFSSRLVDRYNHENFKKMVAMGESIIPLLLKDLEQKEENGEPEYGFAFLVLGGIVGDSKFNDEPIIINGKETNFRGLNIMQTIDDWVAWGKQNNYI